MKKLIFATGLIALLSVAACQKDQEEPETEDQFKDNTPEYPISTSRLKYYSYDQEFMLSFNHIGTTINLSDIQDNVLINSSVLTFFKDDNCVGIWSKVGGNNCSNEFKTSTGIENRTLYFNVQNTDGSNYKNHEKTLLKIKVYVIPKKTKTILKVNDNLQDLSYEDVRALLQIKEE